MNQFKFSMVGVIVAVVGWVCSPTASAQPVLSGLINFSTDATGANSDVSIWNTLGGDGRFDLYATQPNTGINGAFLNTGDGVGASINLALPVGTYNFFLFGEPGADIGHFGLNLFFDGNVVDPKISVFAASDQPPSPPFPDFAADGSANTQSLDSSTTPGAGTLSYTSGGFTTTLTDYRWSVPGVENLNRVQAFDSTTGGANDFVGSFTLQVSAVPEPMTGLVMAGFCSVGLLGRRRPRGAVRA